ncbi:MAG: FHA domain-containing protein, partial [Syntrophobacteria bacterium]
VLEAQKQGMVLGDVLEARVIEIQERKERTSPPNVTIGRAAQNDIILYNKMVSKAHAYLEISETGEGSCLVDVESKNGTFLNGSEILSNQSYQLKDGDEISFGPETTVVYFSSRTFHEFLNQLKMPSA